MNEAEILIQQLATGKPVPKSKDLLDLVDEMGLAYTESTATLWLNSPLELLNADTIRSSLTPDVIESTSTVDIHWSIDSTNAALMSKIDDDDFHGSVCLAERQVSGRGRRGRKWVSPFGKNIYLSLGWQMSIRDVRVEGLSLVIGMQVVKSLRALGVNHAALKWPNDILLDNGKLCGILIEMGTPVNGNVKLVIGIGVNLQMEKVDAAEIDQPWSQISSVQNVSRNFLISQLINNISAELRRFSRTGFKPYQAAWQNDNLYQNKQVRVLIGDTAIEGIDRGVDQNGNLLLETAKGIVTYNAGEVSLRAMA